MNTAQYWELHDRVQVEARERRPSRNRPGSVEAFLRWCEAQPGWRQFERAAQIFRDWLTTQYRTAFASTRNINPVFVSEMPDVTGRQIKPGFDSAKAIAYFKANPKEFEALVFPPGSAAAA